MADTKTYACRNVAGGELHLRRASDADPWEISLFDRFSHFQPVGISGILCTQTLVEHPVLHRTYSTPEEAALAVQQAVGA